MKKIIACIAAIIIVGGTALGVFIYKNSDKTEEVTAAKQVVVSRGNVTAGITESAAVSVESLEQTFDLSLTSTSVSASVESSGGGSGSSGASPTGVSMGGSGGSSKSRSGSSSMGSTSVSTKSEASSVELVVDKVLVTEGQTVNKGDTLMTITQESIDSARALLTKAVQDAELALKQAQIEEAETKLSARYEYDTRIAEGKNAQKVYNAALDEIAQNIASLKSQISDLNTQIASSTDDKQTSQLKSSLNLLNLSSHPLRVRARLMNLPPSRPTKRPLCITRMHRISTTLR